MDTSTIANIQLARQSSLGEGWGAGSIPLTVWVESSSSSSSSSYSMLKNMNSKYTIVINLINQRAYGPPKAQVASVLPKPGNSSRFLHDLS